MFHSEFPRQPHLSIRRRLPLAVDYAKAYLDVQEVLNHRLADGAPPKQLGIEFVALIDAARRRTSQAEVTDSFDLYSTLLSVHRSTLSGIRNYFVGESVYDVDPDGVIDPATIPTEAEIRAWAHPL